VGLSSQRTAAARWLAGADPAGLLYGAIVGASVLATVSAHGIGVDQVAIATAIVLFVYWLAHVYIAALSRQFVGDRGHLLRRFGHEAWQEVGVLKGGSPVILVYLLAAVWVDKSTAASVAVYFSAVLLAGAGYLGAHQAGIKGRAALWETLGAATFGLLVVLMKALLH
jgi:hypothetical protein